MPESAAEQAKNALGVIEKALGEAGFALADVVRATYYFTDTAYWDEVGPTLGAAFGDIRPAASAIVVGLVKPEMKVEIEEIGRASCRERVCQYVEISVVAVALKKKK